MERSTRNKHLPYYQSIHCHKKLISLFHSFLIKCRYSLADPQRATQRLKFIEKYRSYVINYNIGKDMVESYIEKQGGTAENVEKR
jgi:hypothetical protein